jgi:hypothetical protein
MTTAMPSPVPLDKPPGDLGALAGLVREVAGAAGCLAAVDDRLLGAATTAPGWLGDDAAAAAAQVGAVTALVGAVSDAVLPAIGRLNTHAERLLETRRQVAALVTEQREQFAEAWGRWAQVESLQLQVMSGGADVRAIVEEVEAGEASRRRRHTALLEELEDDAAATARVLADCCAVVGGRGAPGDANRVVAYLAARLPGWGDEELAGRGRALANRLTGPATSETRAAAAEEAAPFAGRTAFANALLAGIGEEGVTYLLTFLGDNVFGPESSVARLLAAVFGAAAPSGGAHDPVGDVLNAEYVRAEDRNGVSDTAAAGLATVLAAGLSMPSGGVQTRTVAGWSRQLLLWEHEQRMPVGMRSVEGAPEVSDPTALAIGILADRADAAVSAALLDDTRVWEALLSRVWGDAGVALGEIVTQAALEPGAAGDHAVRTGLQVGGAGLEADDPADWTVNRDTLAAIAPALGGAVAAHVSVAVDALQVGVDGRSGGGRADVLQGLGYVTLDRGAVAEIEQALHRWALSQPGSLDGTGSLSPLPAIAVPSAYLALQQFAQRSDYALDCLEARKAAENRAEWWRLTVGLYAQLVPGYGGIAAGVLEGELAIVFDMDGTWENGADRGLVFDRNDAAAAALAQLPPERSADAQAVRQQAIAAFDRTATALGVRRPPASPEADYAEPLLGGLTDVEKERAERDHGRAGGRLRLPR